MSSEDRSAFKAGGGTMGAKLRAFDWAATPLGAIDTWSPVMRSTVNTAMLSGFPVALFFGPDLICIYNDGYAPMLGQKPEALGVPLRETWAEVWEQLKPIAEKALAGEPTFIEDYPLETLRFGKIETGYFTFSYSPIFDGDGEVIGMIDTVVETTAGVVAREAAKREVERHIALLQQMPGFAGVTTGPEHVYTYVNDAYRALSGPRDFIGRNVRQVFPEVADQGFFEILDEVYRSGERFVSRGSAVRFEGEDSDRYVDLLFEATRNDRGEITGLFIGGYDVTEQKRVAEELRRSEGELRALNDELETRVAGALAERKVFSDVIDGSTAAVTALDLDYRILAINRSNVDAFERVFGKRPRVGDLFLDLFADMSDHVAQQREIWGRALAGEEFFIIQEFGDDAFERRHYEVRFSVLKDADGRIIGASSTSYDVTARVQAEQKLLTAQEQLRQAQKMEAVGQLTGGIAHDFNNMLAVVSGSLDLLDRRTPDDDSRAKRLISAGQEAAKRAASLTKRLLAFSRQQPLDPEVVDINRLVSGMSDLFRHSLGGDVQLETVLAGGVWPVFIDQNQLESILLNLAVNARDAMPGGGHLTIETQNAHLDSRYAAEEPGVVAGQYVMVAVTDTGTGMTAEVIAKAFDPFFTTKEVGKGTGLGLSQVYGFIKQSGGHIKIYSEVGHGTTIRIYLPRHMGATGHGDAEATTAGLPVAESREVVLVVDDEAIVRQFSVDALFELGYGVVSAGSAVEALAILGERSDIDLLFTDIVMPEVNGRQLADSARRLRPGLPVLYTTGYTRNAIVHNGVLDAGVDLIGKPFTIDELAVKVREVLDRALLKETVG